MFDFLRAQQSFRGASSRIWVNRDHNFLVGEDTSVNNFVYLDGEFSFFDKDLFGNFVMKLGRSWGYFGILELGIMGRCFVV